MNERELILASTSSARRSLIDALGVPYRAVAPGVDEDVAPGTSAEAAVLQLAERKAQAVFTRFPGALVIGADQLVSVEGNALGKPPNAAAAKAQLARLSGRTHEILTAVCLIGPHGCTVEVDRAVLTVRSLSERELDGYVATGEWQGCAGGYRVEGRGQVIFEHIEGDRTSIQGLPMPRVIRLLRAAGFNFF